MAITEIIALGSRIETGIPKLLAKNGLNYKSSCDDLYSIDILKKIMTFVRAEIRKEAEKRNQNGIIGTDLRLSDVSAQYIQNTDNVIAMLMDSNYGIVQSNINVPDTYNIRGQLYSEYEQFMKHMRELIYDVLTFVSWPLSKNRLDFSIKEYWSIVQIYREAKSNIIMGLAGLGMYNTISIVQIMNNSKSGLNFESFATAIKATTNIKTKTISLEKNNDSMVITGKYMGDTVEYIIKLEHFDRQTNAHFRVMNVNHSILTSGANWV